MSAKYSLGIGILFFIFSGLSWNFWRAEMFLRMKKCFLNVFSRLFWSRKGKSCFNDQGNHWQWQKHQHKYCCSKVWESARFSRGLWRERVWRNFGYFDTRKSDYSMEKVNFPENTLLYINQAFLTVQKSKNIFYCDYYVLGVVGNRATQHTF